MLGPGREKLGGGCVAIAIVLLLALVLPASGLAAGGHGKPRARVVVASGSVVAAGSGLSGSFVVRNEGGRRSGRFTAGVVVGPAQGEVSVRQFPMMPLGAGVSRTVKVAAPVPAGLPQGVLPIRACVTKKAKKGKRSQPRCTAVGTLRVGGSSPTPGPGPTPSPPSSAGSVPPNPISFNKGTAFTLNDPEGNYWIYVPTGYDSSHQTPTPLLVWLHGCGGESAGDINTVSPGGSQDWISIAVGGREGGCWDPGGDGPKVMAAIADVKSHFNVDPHRVILGGYSSGGDLAYRLAFYNSGAFAGVLAENTAPFRDTGSGQAESLAAATTKFHVVHLAHLRDTTYPIAQVRAETDAMIAAGFPLSRIEVDGTHYDEPGAMVNGHPVPGTDADLVNLLLPHIDDGWRSP
ncbi:MAG: hypothetical protein JST08_20135 [Actinobacteria bacterium]|nr:hypothetical protein [Actinomycetota bacterium]